jgi:hypothetical protein
MQGYCPTRANQAPGNGPHAPRVAWAVTPFPIDTPESFLPAEIVVDATGRAYVAISGSPMNPVGGPNQIFAVDPDGSVAWTTPFTSTVSNLILAGDGTLWVAGSPIGPPPSTPPACPPGDAGEPTENCVWGVSGLSPAGAFSRTVTFIAPGPPFENNVGYNAVALGSNGSFFLEGTAQFGFGNGVARAAPSGTVEWQWPALGPSGEYFQLVPPLVVGPSDDVVGTDGESVVVLDAAGNPLLQQDIGGAQLVGVDAQGNIVALSTDTMTLTTLDVNGNTLRLVPLAVTIGTTDAAELALAGDGTTVVLLANEASSPGLTKAEVQILAVDASGGMRWTTTLDATLPYDPAALPTHYGLFVDASGTVVVTVGAVTGIDLATGSTLWTLQPPNPRSCLRPAVLGAAGAIIASQCDGTVFLASDP